MLDGQYPDVSLIYPQQQLDHIPRSYIPSWERQRVGNLTLAELSQSETVSSSQQSCFPDSLASVNTFAALAAEAQHLLGSASQNRESLSNYSSICSSASTVTSSIACGCPTLAASSFGIVPSFDFKRHEKQRALSEYTSAYFHGSGVDKSTVARHGSLSVGTGYILDSGARWQEPSAMESEELEEYSLGSGLPG
jgi:hypothetical protein